MVSSGRAAPSNGGAPARAFGSNRWSATDESVEGVNGCSKGEGEGEEPDPSGDEGPTFSLHSQEGDTEAVIMVTSFNQLYVSTLAVNWWFKLSRDNCSQFLQDCFVLSRSTQL